MAAATYLGVRGLHLLVHLQRVMMEPHFHEHLQESAGGSTGPGEGSGPLGGERAGFPPRLLGRQDPAAHGRSQTLTQHRERKTTHRGSKT